MTSLGLLMREVRRLSRALLTEGRGSMTHVESMEQRQMLAGTPLPEISALENANRPVVRFETNFGDVDIELFSDIVPNTVNNFLQYVRSGRYDQSLFHRMTLDADPQSGIQVLQGGGFALSNTNGLNDIPAESPVNLEFVANRRSNTALTIAAARTNQPNTATSQFFFNLNDNTNLDSSSATNGFVVFGRVIQGSTVLTTINGLSRRNFSTSTANNPNTQVSDPAITGSIFGGNFGFTPVTANYSQTTGARENAFVTITNAEVIKPTSVAGFFTQRLVSPEGFNSVTTTETLDLSNPNSVAVTYQLIARYEFDGPDFGFARTNGRDQVLQTGTIGANSKLRVTLSSTSGADLVQEGAYTLVTEIAVPSSETNPRTVGASFTRQDFGAVASEALINTNLLSNADQRDWLFPRIERNDQSVEFLLLYNNSDQIANVTIDFVTPEGPRTLTRVLKPYSRGGSGLFAENLPLGLLSARVRSDQPILASLSDWDLPDPNPTGVPPANSTVFTPGSMVNGIPGGGSTEGAIARVQRVSDDRGEISLYNPTTSSTNVTLSAYRNDGTRITQSVSLLANSRSSINVDFGLFDGQVAAVQFDSGSVPIGVQYSLLPAPTLRGQFIVNKSDNAATSFSRGIGGPTIFAEGAFATSTASGGQFRENLSIFNPFNAATLTYTVTYVFSDGTQLVGATGSLAAKNRVDVNTPDLTSVVAKINSGAQFRNYAIVVTGTAVQGGSAPDIVTPGLVSLTREDTRLGQAILTSGFLGTFLLPFTDARFDPIGTTT
jgi:cyclophilin family peptidyl-prolyl cis-trans isomerase